jgi:HEAT repeat protein
MESEITIWITQLTSGDDRMAEAAVTQLSNRPDEALPELKKLLSASDADHRWWAVRALAEVADKRAVPLLLAALGDENDTVRQCAALAFRQQPDPQAIHPLLDLLANDDRMLAHLAADALIAIGKPAVPALMEALEKNSPASRLEAMRALAGIGDTSAIPVMFAALEQDSALLEYWADEGLERMGVGMNFFKT